MHLESVFGWKLDAIKILLELEHKESYNLKTVGGMFLHIFTWIHTHTSHFKPVVVDMVLNPF